MFISRRKVRELEEENKHLHERINQARDNYTVLYRRLADLERFFSIQYVQNNERQYVQVKPKEDKS